MDKIDELLSRGVANVIPGKEELKKLLQTDKKLHIYLGIDPTATRIHLGHAVPLRKLQAFADLGHQVTFLIGDFTALIGDTSDKDTERPVLTSEEIEENFKTYKKQAEKILDFSKITVVNNSEWLRNLSFTDIVKLTQHFSAGDFYSRELIKKRLQEGKHVGLHELLYPVMQGYDSYHLDTDIQIGGTDQTFNMQAGRTLQHDLRKKESCVLAMEFLEGTDGRKMSKSWGNAIWLEDIPSDMYAKIMAINDDLITQYYTLGTNIPLEEIEKIKARLTSSENPMNIKKELAHHLITELHSKAAADQAAENFKLTVQDKEKPSDIRANVMDKTALEHATIADILTTTGIVLSKAEAKRVVEQGGVSINDEKITDALAPFAPFLTNGDAIIQKGKNTFVKIQLSK